MQRHHLYGKTLKKYVFHEVEVGGTAFKATFDEGTAGLHVEDATGRESRVYLMGSESPSLFYAESWTMRGRELGPVGRSVMTPRRNPSCISAT